MSADGTRPMSKHEPDDWRLEALCRGRTPIFYTGRGENRTQQEAKAMCRRCPVMEQCRAEAEGRPERFGTWGGQSERTRRTIRRRKP